MLTEEKTKGTVLNFRKGVGFAELSDWGIVEVSGPDALEYMHNRTTNDVKALQLGQGQASTVLDRKAHVQATFSLHRREDKLLILVEKSQISTLMEEIEKYHIIERFTLTNISNLWRVFTIQGPTSTAFLTSGLMQTKGFDLKSEYETSDLNLFGSDVTVIRRSLTGEVGYCILVPIQQSIPFKEALLEAGRAYGLMSLSPPVLEILRVEAGIPKMGIDMDRETLLPETGLEQIAVSYSKGCYLGQETVARVKTYGAVQKVLMGLIFKPGVTLPPVGTPCILEEKPVGTLKSSVDSPTLQTPIALAYLNKDQRIPGKTLILEMLGNSYEVTVTPLPFYNASSEIERAKHLFEKGLREFADGKEQQAIQSLRQAIESNPHLYDAYESLGVILSRHEEYEEAISLMHKLSELDPKRVMAHTNLSIYYMKLGDKERAEEEKAKATVLAMQNAFQDSKTKTDEESERRKRQEVALQRIDLFKQALALTPDEPLANFGIASAYLELERFEEAIPAFEKALAAQPNHSVAYLSLGKSLEGAKRFEEALSVYQKGIEIASRRGDRMPQQEMQDRLELLSVKQSH